MTWLSSKSRSDGLLKMVIANDHELHHSLETALQYLYDQSVQLGLKLPRCICERFDSESFSADVLEHIKRSASCCVTEFFKDQTSLYPLQAKEIEELKLQLITC